MNERYEQLLAQAYIEFAPDSKAVSKRFAELIVKECCKHIRDRAMRAGGACTIVGEEGLWLAKDVEQHFGVEE